MLLAPFQQRVVDEKEDLEEKMSKLCIFMDNCGTATSVYHKLPDDEKFRMEQQRLVMRLYINILAERIAHFS